MASLLLTCCTKEGNTIYQPNPNEEQQSFADSWSNELGVWMCDRFSRNLIGHATEYPNGTYRDLYLYCAQHTLGSHAGIYNYTNFGNLYITGPKDFFVKK